MKKYIEFINNKFEHYLYYEKFSSNIINFLIEYFLNKIFFFVYFINN